MEPHTTILIVHDNSLFKKMCVNSSDSDVWCHLGFTNVFLRQIEHQMTVFKGQLGTNLSTIPFHFKTHWDMKLGTRPRAAGTNTSPENCVGIYGDKYFLPSPCTGSCRWPQLRRRTRWEWERPWPAWRGSPWGRMAETGSLLRHQRSQNCGGHCNRSYLKCRVLAPSGSLILWPSSGGKMRNLDDSWCVATLTMTGLLCPPTSLA